MTKTNPVSPVSPETLRPMTTTQFHRLNPLMVGQTPRRIRTDLAIPAERAIREALAAVENAGADPLLTDAVIFLGYALEKVADWYENVGLIEENFPADTTPTAVQESENG